MPQQYPWNQSEPVKVQSWSTQETGSSRPRGGKLVEETFPAYDLEPKTLLEVLKRFHPKHKFKDTEPIVRSLISWACLTRGSNPTLASTLLDVSKLIKLLASWRQVLL